MTSPRSTQPDLWHKHANIRNTVSSNAGVTAYGKIAQISNYSRERALDTVNMEAHDYVVREIRA